MATGARVIRLSGLMDWVEVGSEEAGEAAVKPERNWKKKTKNMRRLAVSMMLGE